MNNTVENSQIRFGRKTYKNFFSINYGTVEYVDWKNDRRNTGKFPTPILYTYLKDKKCFEKENELRISLSTIGLGQIVLPDGNLFNFPESIQMDFVFKNVILQEILFTNVLNPDLKKVISEKLQDAGAQISGTSKF
ncbi:MAG: hypothetical protein IIB64_00890 [Proteobacteria bacterium]|nr:hypothetical protein [Pseudomonadota bacterium]